MSEWRELHSLPDEIVHLLDGSQPLPAVTIKNILVAARGLYLSDGEPGATLDVLVREGRIVRLTSAKIPPRYRLPKPDPQTAA